MTFLSASLAWLPEAPLLCDALAAVLAVPWWLDRRQRRLEEEQRVEDGIKLIRVTDPPRVVRVGDVPIVPGLSEPKLVLPVLSHRSEQTATTPLSYRPRHAALDVRDVNRAGIRSVTREFAALVRDNFGVNVTGRAPVEAELAREWAEVAT